MNLSNNKKTILITGGSGFLGRNLAIALKEEYNVVISGRNNSQNNFAEGVTGCPSIPLDITNIESIRDGINLVKPNIIIHAAATKYVGLSEKFPMECIDVNVIGSQNVARVAIDKGVEIVVGISTDKAAPPCGNTYAMSKAIMERAFCSLNTTGPTKFTCVRFGNLAWSTGSVFPIWKSMLDKNGIIESTGPNMRRYFISVQEAVQIIIDAFENIDETQAAVITRDMKAVQIADILDVWVDTFGGSWKQIEERQGDSIDEHLIGETELEFSKKVKLNGQDYYITQFNKKQKTGLKELVYSKTAERLSKEEIKHLITVLPE